MLPISSYSIDSNDSKIVSMVSIELDMIQTAGVGALALLVGMVLTRKVAFLQKFCVPSPVSGGIIFSLITLTEILCAVASKRWYHLFIDHSDTLWLVRY